MAITISVDALISANRVGATAIERAEISRLRDYAIAEISAHVGTAYADIDETIVNEAAVRMVGYLYDQPTIARGAAFANAMRNSGAGRMLFRFRVHRAGLATPGEAMAAGIGTTGNPVVDVEVISGELVITFADGSSETHTLPAAGAFGVDQTARDLAGTAHTEAEAAQTDIDDHEANHPSGSTVDQDARNEAVGAQATADANTLALADKLERSDVNAGVGISVLADIGSTTGVTISLTGSGLGPMALEGGQWQWAYTNAPNPGEIGFHGTAITVGIYEWIFDVGGSYGAAQAQLLALTTHDEIEIRQHATRHQLVTLTSSPTLSAGHVTVTGTLDRGSSFLLPEDNADVSVTLIPGPIQGVDQTARDDAAAALAAHAGMATAHHTRPLGN